MTEIESIYSIYVCFILFLCENSSTEELPNCKFKKLNYYENVLQDSSLVHCMVNLNKNKCAHIYK